MRKRKAPSKKAQSHLDHDLRKKTKANKDLKARAALLIKQAAANSKSGIRGTDNVDYDGPERRRLNRGRMGSALAKYRQDKVDSEQAKRTSKRKRLSKNIIERQKRKTTRK